LDYKRVQYIQSKSSGIESRKSTSDRTKRREAHKAEFSLPVITKPALAEKPEQKQIKKLVLKKDGVCTYVLYILPPFFAYLLKS